MSASDHSGPLAGADNGTGSENRSPGIDTPARMRAMEEMISRAPRESAPDGDRADTASAVKDSKFLALVLRHDPGRVGVALDPAGWVDVDTLLSALKAHGRPYGRARLERIVAENDKRRFEFDADGRRIRASQGHSVPVELGYPVCAPPPVLFHGTAAASVRLVSRDGLLPGKRHHVHLSADQDTALRVGARHGRPVVLRVDAEGMARDGYVFHVSTNEVWLTAAVPPRYLRALPDNGIRPGSPSPPHFPNAPLSSR